MNINAARWARSGMADEGAERRRTGRRQQRRPAHDALNALIDLGTGSSTLMNTGGNLQYDWGALHGGANTG